MPKKPAKKAPPKKKKPVKGEKFRKLAEAVEKDGPLKATVLATGCRSAKGDCVNSLVCNLRGECMYMDDPPPAARVPVRERVKPIVIGPHGQVVREISPAPAPFKFHAVHPACGGEFCGMCWREGKREVPATHKIGEEIQADDQGLISLRHNLTQYICCACFEKCFGPSCRKQEHTYAESYVPANPVLFDEMLRDMSYAPNFEQLNNFMMLYFMDMRYPRADLIVAFERVKLAKGW